MTVVSLYYGSHSPASMCLKYFKLMAELVYKGTVEIEVNDIPSPADNVIL